MIAYHDIVVEFTAFVRNHPRAAHLPGHGNDGKRASMRDHKWGAWGHCAVGSFVRRNQRRALPGFELLNTDEVRNALTTTVPDTLRNLNHWRPYTYGALSDLLRTEGF